MTHRGCLDAARGRACDLSGSAKMQGRGNGLSSVSLVLVFISSLVCV